MSQTYIIEFHDVVPTLNAERAANRWVRAAFTKKWREAFGLLARAQHVPALTEVSIEVDVQQRAGRLQDTVACAPGAKAAIDGLVDAGVMPDDSPTYLRRVAFNPPTRGRALLRLTVTGTPTAPCKAPTWEST